MGRLLALACALVAGVLLAWAGDEANGPAYRGLLAEAKRWRPIALPIGGADVLALGIAPGPEVGKLLSAGESWWQDGDFAANRAECLARLASLARA